ncbi:MAG: SDR family oxidoreductase [Thermoleophilia bacterium]|nr:SDR family oxidoreductase [Thermoleophilia bacterium]
MSEYAGARRPFSEPVKDLRRVMDVSGKGVIVTGGANGIGWGIAQAFAERGARVAILDVEAETGRARVEELNRLAGGSPAGAAGDVRHIFVECDITSRAAVDVAVEEAVRALGHIDVLVNNAGIAVTKPFLDFDPDLSDWRRVIEVNLHGTALVTHAVANYMRRAGRGGLIINISSVGGARCSASKELPNSAYVASKAALNHLTAAWAIEFAEYGIRVNAIMPGPTHSRLDAQLTPEYMEKIADGILDGRWGEPLEIGALCVFMASAEGAHLNGVVIPHDGGFLCVH